MTASRHNSSRGSLRTTRLHSHAWLLLAVTLCACASQPAAHPKTASRYDGGKCVFLGLMEVEHAVDVPSDSVSLVANYRFGPSEIPTNERIRLAFQVSRLRVNDLRAHLTAHPTVLCEPDPSPGASSTAYEIDVPPFEGQRGTPLR